VPCRRSCARSARARPRRTDAGGWEPSDIADLGDHEHRGVAPDPADLAEHLHPLVGLGARVDLTGGRGDLAIKVTDQRQEAVQPPAGPVGQLEAREELLSALAEQVGVFLPDALSGQQRVDPVLDRGAHPAQHGAVPQQLAQVAQLGRGDVRLGQKPRAQQVREGLGVDRVGLHPRGGDRLGPQRMREVHVLARLLQQVGEPLPAVGRLERDVRPLRIAEQLLERFAVIDDPPRQRQLAVLVDAAICERRRCRSMPTQRLPLVMVGPPLELSGRAGAIRTVSNDAVRAGGPTSCRPAGARRPGLLGPARPFMTSTPECGSGCRRAVKRCALGPASRQFGDGSAGSSATRVGSTQRRRWGSPAEPATSI
jgi:hypothetical protein